jgi:putative endonuclease
MDKVFMVYILASRRNGTLYIGVTGNPLARMWHHRDEVVDGFTKRYGVKRLVWYEFFVDATLAIQRGKQLKEWHRAWNIRLIEEFNPDWRDLYTELTGETSPRPQCHSGEGRNPS